MDFVKPVTKIEEKKIKINGLDVNYKIIGNGDIPIILLHGWGVSGDKYLELAKYLSQFSPPAGGFNIIIPDLPGFGKSGDPPMAWSVGNYTELVKELSSVLKLEKFILIGHSFGGRIAIKFAVNYPDKIKILILTGAAGIKHPPALKQKIFYTLAKTGKVIFSLPLINKLEKSAKKLLYKAAGEKDYYQARGTTKDTFKKVLEEDLTPCLEMIKVPVLLVWGKNDRSTPLSDAHIMEEKIRFSHMEIIENSNHALPYQYPEKFAKIISDFIKKTMANCHVV